MDRRDDNKCLSRERGGRRAATRKHRRRSWSFIRSLEGRTYNQGHLDRYTLSWKHLGIVGQVGIFLVIPYIYCCRLVMYTQYSAGGRPRSLSLHVIHRYPHSESRSFVDLQVPLEHASCSSRSVGVDCTMRVCPPSIWPCISM